jgi:hypothetical protein
VTDVEGNWPDEAWHDILIQNADDAVEFFMPDPAGDMRLRIGGGSL